MFSLKDKVVIITGAAGLLGSNYAKYLYNEYCHLILTDLNMTSLDLLKADLIKNTEEKGRIITLEQDISQEVSWLNLKEICLKEFKNIDVLINNAAYTGKTKHSNFNKTFFDTDIEGMNDVLKVNVTGTFIGCKVIGEVMCKQKSGSIINISSIYGIVSPHHYIYKDTDIVNPVAYSLSKSAIVALTKYCGTLMASDNVRVNCITPGGVENAQDSTFLKRYNELNPSGRMANKNELLGAVLFLASDASSYCVGHNLVVDGGWTAW